MATVVLLYHGGGSDLAAALGGGFEAGPCRWRCVRLHCDIIEDNPWVSASSSEDNTSPSHARFTAALLFRLGKVMTLRWKVIAIGGD
jgi:hypothetical protein